MFRAFSRPSSGAQWLQWQPAGRPARPRTHHDCHHNTKVKPEAATAVTELLMIGGKTPEICWAVNKRQNNKLENCCIWLVIYLNFTMMHGLTSLKKHFTYQFIFFISSICKAFSSHELRNTTDVLYHICRSARRPEKASVAEWGQQGEGTRSVYSIAPTEKVWWDLQQRHAH